MKKKVKLLCGVLVTVCFSCLLGVFGSACAKSSREGEKEFLAYTLSDVVMTQKGVNTYSFEFSADCAGDGAKVYFTENDRIKNSDSPVDVESAENDGLVRYSFTSDLQLSEEYYLWVVSDEKEVMLPITAPSMFPSMETRVAGGAIFHFNFTTGVSWSSFCDPDGKAVYMGDNDVFDETAKPVAEGIVITEGDSVIAASKFDGSKFYYSVTTAKNGLLKIISSPITLTSALFSRITDITATLNTKPSLEVGVELEENSDIAQSADLQLVIKNSAGDEIYSANPVWKNNTAGFTFDCTMLLKADLWYDIALAYKGAIICDVPKFFGGRDIVDNYFATVEGIDYCLTEWKADDAPEEEAALKLYFKRNTTRYADEFCQEYLVTLDDSNGLVLNVRLKLKDGVQIPELAVTGGSEEKIVGAQGNDGGNGYYTYSLDISSALTEEGKWYDIRLFFGDVYAELLKDSCITYSDFAEIYNFEDKIITFCEWNGILKITYSV